MYIYIARQPIFDKKKNIVAYELLYRNDESNRFDPSVSGDKATLRLLSRTLLDFDMQTVVGGRKAYVNFTEHLLNSGLPYLLDKGMFVLEILEDVRLDGDNLRRLKELRSHGYILALDDYDGKPLEPDVLDLLDIVKLDFKLLSREGLPQIAANLRSHHITLLAEKIETGEDFDLAVSVGCKLFQGYCLSKPLVLKKKGVGISKASTVQLFQALSSASYDINRLTEIIRIDSGLTYKLLKKMSTAAYYRGHTVQSVRDALVRMGMDETRRWAALVLMQDLTGTDSDEQVFTALVRAVFCEQMAKETNDRRLVPDAFITGMFSILEADNEEMNELLSILGVSRQVFETLIGKKKNNLSDYLQTVIFYENCNWDKLFERYSKSQLAKIQEVFVSAIQYANRVLPPAG